MPSDAFISLLRFLTSEMRMSHVYQPVMLRALYAEERAELIRLCHQKAQDFLERRGDAPYAPWSHRQRSSGYVPGSLRYSLSASTCAPYSMVLMPRPQ